MSLLYADGLFEKTLKCYRNTEISIMHFAEQAGDGEKNMINKLNIGFLF